MSDEYNSPYLLWTGRATPEAQSFLRRCNGPYWIESDGALVLSQGTEGVDEENIRVRVGEWVTWCGDGHGFELGQVMPVFMRVGWDSTEIQVGWVQQANQMPALLRSMSDQWSVTAAAEKIIAEEMRLIEEEGKLP